MARNRHGQGVCTASLSHRTDCFRHSNFIGDIGIGDRGPGRNLLKRLPHAPLKCGSTNVEGQVESDSGFFDEADHLRNEVFVAGFVSDQICFGKTVLEVAHQERRIVSEKNRAHALAALRNEDRAQGTLPDREKDVRVGAAGAECGRSHAENCVGGFVETAT